MTIGGQQRRGGAEQTSGVAQIAHCTLQTCARLTVSTSGWLAARQSAAPLAPYTLLIGGNKTPLDYRKQSSGLLCVAVFVFVSLALLRAPSLRTAHFVCRKHTARFGRRRLIATICLRAARKYCVQSGAARNANHFRCHFAPRECKIIVASRRGVRQLFAPGSRQANCSLQSRIRSR